MKTKDRSVVQGVPHGVKNYSPVQLPSATPTTPDIPHYTDLVFSMPAHGTREEPPSMFSASMAPRDRGAPEVNPSAEVIAVVPTKAETVWDMENTTTFIDSDSSLVQEVPHGVVNSFPERLSVPTHLKCPIIQFLLLYPASPPAHRRGAHPPMDTPHGGDNDTEGSRGGDMSLLRV